MIRVFFIGFLLLRFINANSQNSFPDFEELRIKILGDSILTQVKSSINSEKLKQFNETNEIPIQLIELFTQWNNDEFKIANPGDPYNATDLIFDDSLPRRRLIKIFKNEIITIIHYEHGGIGNHNHLVWSECKKGIIKDLWTCTTFDDILTERDLINFINNYSRVIELKNGKKIVNTYIHF